jgi:putative ABC transport system permease protein
MLEDIRTDIRYTTRMLVKAPGFTLPVMATIALAIGAITAVFATLHSIVLQPLPFGGSSRVVSLCETNPSLPAGWCGSSPANVEDWRRQARTLENAGVARNESFVARDGAVSYGVRGGIASPGFFDVLQVKPALGRGLEERDLETGANHVAIISHTFWVEHLGSDPAAVGRSIVLDRTPFTVIGVLPARVWLPDTFADVDVWKPLTASIDDVTKRSWRGFVAIGRLAPGVTRTQFMSEMAVIRAQLAAAYPESNKDWGFQSIDFREHLVGDYSATLWLFLGMAALVLLIACVNVAGLLLVRTTARAAELAVRTAVGAGRRRLVTQLLTESALMSLAGGAAGLLIGAWATRLFVLIAPADTPRLSEVTLDWPVVLFTFVLVAAISIVFGIAPARRAWNADVTATLKGLRGSTAADVRTRSALTAAQLAFALMLLFGAGLLARTFVRFASWDPGFERSNLSTTWMLPPNAHDPQATITMMERVREAVATLPGIQSAALGSAGPLFGGEESGELKVVGRSGVPGTGLANVNWFDIDAHYFSTLGVPIRKGRAFSPADTASAPPVAVVNQALADRAFPGKDAIGQQVVVEQHPATIVGIVADTSPLEPNAATPPEIYWPIQQYPRGAAYLILRTGGTSAPAQQLLRSRVAAVNPDIQLNAIMTLDERFARRLVSPKFNMLLVGFFAAIAGVLAALGVYSVAAYAVATRTREFAVRMALGSTPTQLVTGVLREGVRLAAIGIVAGSIGAVLVGRALTTILFGVSPVDPLTFGGTAALLAVIAVQAAWWPARRASRIDPSAALRGQ